MNDDAPGRHMRAEIAAQPEVFAAVTARQAEIAQVGAVLADRAPRFVLLAARGSSDHAALYAKYLIEVLLELPAGLVSASTTTLYGAKPDLADGLFVTVSRSGGSADLGEATRAAAGRRPLTGPVA